MLTVFHSESSADKANQQLSSTPLYVVVNDQGGVVLQEDMQDAQKYANELTLQQAQLDQVEGVQSGLRGRAKKQVFKLEEIKMDKVLDQIRQLKQGLKLEKGQAVETVSRIQPSALQHSHASSLLGSHSEAFKRLSVPLFSARGLEVKRKGWFCFNPTTITPHYLQLEDLQSDYKQLQNLNSNESNKEVGDNRKSKDSAWKTVKMPKKPQIIVRDLTDVLSEIAQLNNRRSNKDEESTAIIPGIVPARTDSNDNSSTAKKKNKTRLLLPTEKAE
eukprot:gene25268-31702_t